MYYKYYDLELANQQKINCEIFKSPQFYFLKYIISEINRNNNYALLVGGVVRDFINDNIISYDIDIATTMPANEVFNLFVHNKLKMPCFWAGKEIYNTISLVCNDYKIDITTLRKDVECDGRFAKTATVDSYFVDSCRRDFTVNSLYLDIDNEVVFDFHSGLNDLSQKKIKFIGNIKQRIEEDYLRILRYFRFCSKFDSNCEKEICETIEQYNNKLKTLSKERITNEMFKIIFSKHSKIEEMEKFGILKAIGFEIGIKNKQGKVMLDNYHKNTKEKPTITQMYIAFLIENINYLELIIKDKILTIPNKITSAILKINNFLKEYTTVEFVDLLLKNNENIQKTLILISWQNNLREFLLQELISLSNFHQIKVEIEKTFLIMKDENILQNIEFNKNTKLLIIEKQINLINILKIK
jgi:poly(A) polymerase